jgi:hypothetical protein
MYKQNPGDPKKKLNTPGTFREDSNFIKLAKDGSNVLFKLDSGVDKHEEELDEVVVYAPYKNRKKPSEVGGTDAQVSGGKKFEVKKGKPVI